LLLGRGEALNPFPFASVLRCGNRGGGDLVGGGPPRSGEGFYGGAAGTVSLGAGRVLCCGPLGALCAVGCGVGVDEGGGALGEVDAGEQRQQVGPPGVSSAKATILCVRAGREAVGPGREGAGLAC